jgi:iron(III) transport system ATP-binding protein
MVNTADGGRALALDPQGVVVTGVSKTYGEIRALKAVDLAVDAGRMLALLGPSGCGKTTLLRVIAGLERPDAGRVVVGDRLLTGDDELVPPERRRIGMVFQDWALFPHLSVERNVGYGVPKLDGAARRTRVADALALVGLQELGARAPGTLSGGQQQRVALARALAPRPSVLLLDEPFSNLDTALRVQVRTEVHRLLADLGITTVFVTHDQEEAFVLGDEVAVMEDGLVVQKATPAELYRSPATRWVASFVGDANLLPATVRDSVADTAVGRVPVVAAPSGPVDVLVRPEDVALEAEHASGAAAGTVELVEFYGHDTVYVVRTGSGTRVRARQGSAPRFGRGDDVGMRYTGAVTVAFGTDSGADGGAGSSVEAGARR